MVEWLEEYKAMIARLSPQQAAIVGNIQSAYGQDTRPLRVIATAGAGKTLGIVATVAYLINSRTVTTPSDIVVLTFTAKARDTVQGRLKRVLPAEATGPNGVRVGTYHSNAYKVVSRGRGRYDFLQRDHDWTLALNLDLAGRERARQKAHKSLEEKIQAARWVELPDLWEAIARGKEKIPGLAEGIVSVQARMHAEADKIANERGKAFRAKKPDPYPNLDLSPLLEPVDPGELALTIERLRARGANTPEEAAELGLVDPEDTKVRGTLYGWRLYNTVKKNLCAWDFADLLHAYYEVVKVGGDRAKLIIIDEVQDNSTVQMAIARKLAENASGRAIYVGDARQCQPAGTLVETPTGEVPIEFLRDGDPVLGWRRLGDTSLEVVTTPRGIRVGRRNYTGRIYTVEVLGCGGEPSVIRTECTENHRWRVQRESRGGLYEIEVTAADLCDGDQVPVRTGPTSRPDLVELLYNTWKLPVPGLDQNGQPVVTWWAMRILLTTPGILTAEQREFIQGLEWSSVSYEPIKVTNRLVLDLPVYSLDVEADHAYIANGICTLNSIYSFRGAAPEILIEADRAENATTLELTTNYRSIPAFVEAGNAIAQGQAWAIGSPAVAFRSGGDEIEYIAAETEMERARRIAKEIAEAKAAGQSLEDFVVLSRTKAKMAPFEVMFLAQGIPARIQGGSPFFKNKPIRRIMAYVRLALGDAPEPVLRKDFGSSIRELGIRARTKAVDDVWEGSGAKNDLPRLGQRLGAWFDKETSRKRDRQLLWGKDREEREHAFETFLDILQGVEKGLGAGTPAKEVVTEIAAALAENDLLCLPELQSAPGADKAGDDTEGDDPTGDGGSDREMVAALLEISGSMSLAELCRLSLRATYVDDVIAESGKISPREEEEAGDREAVTVGTIHSMKGGEKPTVYLLAGSAELPHKGNDKPEERRLFYVGVTRAMNRLVLAGYYNEKFHETNRDADPYHSVYVGIVKGLNQAVDDLDQSLESPAAEGG